MLQDCRLIVLIHQRCDTASSYTHKLELVKEFLEKPDEDLSEICFELGNDVSAVDSVPTAIFCFLRVGSRCEKESQFEETLKLAVRIEKTPFYFSWGSGRL